MIERIWKVYKRHFLLAELIISIFIILATVYVTGCLCPQRSLENWITSNRSTIYPLVATISGTLLGFVITGVSIILAFSESDKLRLLKRSKQYRTIFTIYFSAIKYLALATVVAIVGLAVNDNLVTLMFYLLLWSILISALRIWRCLWILWNIVEIIYKKE